MIDSYLSLNKNLRDLIEHIENNNKIKSFINDVQKEDSQFKQYSLWLDFNSVTSRVFEYNSYIISLYGFFEQFIEQTLAEYIDTICSLYSNYNHLPKEIIDNNIKKNAELLSLLEYPKYKDVDGKYIIKNLYDSIHKKESIINTIAFCHHTSNFRITGIIDYFKSVGVSNLGKNIGLHSPINKVLEDKYGNFSNLPITTIFSIIDELAERRNYIAHGVDKDDILDSEQIINMCNFINDFSSSLSKSLNNSYLNIIHLTENNKLTFNKKKLKAIKIFGNKILCINSNNLNISLQSKILIVSNSIPSYKLSNINNIQYNGKNIKEISPSLSVDIGLELSEKIKDKNKFYLFC